MMLFNVYFRFNLRSNSSLNPKYLFDPGFNPRFVLNLIPGQTSDGMNKVVSIYQCLFCFNPRFKMIFNPRCYPKFILGLISDLTRGYVAGLIPGFILDS